MATYAIGDIQGCYDEFCELLDVLEFEPARDRLWLLGDLINRGPANLQVMRLVMSLGDRVDTVLGNHDLHFLAVHLGGHSPGRSDTFHDLLGAPDVDEIVSWYLRQRLLVADTDLGFAMTHAGIPHIWNLERAAALAAEVEAVISGSDRSLYFTELYGNEPNVWSDTLKGMPRWRSITNYFTRMRLMDANGVLDFAHKGALSDAPPELIPWYELRARQPLGVTTLFGHWAALEGVTGVEQVVALDTGCVWGRQLSAMCLETGQISRVTASVRG